MSLCVASIVLFYAVICYLYQEDERWERGAANQTKSERIARPCSSWDSLDKILLQW